MVQRVRNAVLSEVVDRRLDPSPVALAVHLGRACPSSPSARRPAPCCNRRRRGRAPSRATSRADACSTRTAARRRGGTRSANSRIQWTSRVKIASQKKTLRSAPARLPVPQLGYDVLDRPAANRLLARVLLGEDAVFAEAASERAAAPRDDVELALERRHPLVEDRLVRPREGVEILDERAHRVADRCAVTFEPHVRNVGAPEAVVLRARRADRAASPRPRLRPPRRWPARECCEPAPR